MKVTAYGFTKKNYKKLIIKRFLYYLYLEFIINFIIPVNGAIIYGLFYFSENIDCNSILKYTCITFISLFSIFIIPICITLMFKENLRDELYFFKNYKIDTITFYNKKCKYNRTWKETSNNTTLNFIKFYSKNIYIESFIFKKINIRKGKEQIILNLKTQTIEIYQRRIEKYDNSIFNIKDTLLTLNIKNDDLLIT